jgi:hypothetical protein
MHCNDTGWGGGGASGGCTCWARDSGALRLCCSCWSDWEPSRSNRRRCPRWRCSCSGRRGRRDRCVSDRCCPGSGCRCCWDDRSRTTDGPSSSSPPRSAASRFCRPSGRRSAAITHSILTTASRKQHLRYSPWRRDSSAHPSASRRL